MPTQNKSPSFVRSITLIVAVIVLSGLTLSGLALRENLRFSMAVSQILWIVESIRSLAGQQANFASTANEDLLKDLAGAGQIQSNEGRVNPWQGILSAVAVTPSVMRIETDLPTRDCRRIASYFFSRQPDQIGIISMQVQAFDARWTEIYPVSPAAFPRLVDGACGKAPTARFAMVFKVK